MLASNFNLPFYEMTIMRDDALKQREQLGTQYTPNLILARGNESSTTFLENKPRKEETLFYICENYTCQAPLKRLEKVLAEIQLKV